VEFVGLTKVRFCNVLCHY